MIKYLMVFPFFIVLIIAALFLVILIFSSKQLSPIPYFPTSKIDIPLILKALNLRNGQLVFDLGAGDGVVIFEAASQAYRKKLNTKFIAVEINPILILILHLRRLFHPNKQNIKIVRNDIFSMNFNSLTRKPVNSLTFYLYISPWFLEKVIKNLKIQIKNFAVISYMYPIKSLKKKPHSALRASRGKEKIIRGKNSIFIYS